MAKRHMADRGTRGVLIAVTLLATGLAAGCSNRALDDADATTPAPAATTTPPPPATDTSSDTSTGAPTGAPSDVSTPASTPSATDAPTTTGPPPVMFGDLPSPCGPGDAVIAATGDGGQDGGSTLVLATPTDRAAEVAPGLNGEMYDAARAFADWCNEQGGIAGLQIEVMDADAKLFEVPATMEKVCDQAFAMVGGGWAFDDQEFPRFHECGMIDIAGFTITAAKSMSNGMVAPMPNPSNMNNGLWFEWAKRTHPDAITRVATVYSDILTTQNVEKMHREVMDTLGGFTVVDRIPYSPAGEANWAPIAQRLKDNDVRMLSFVGVPEVLAQLLRSMDEIGWFPDLILLDGGFYADVLTQRAGDAADGIVVRTAYVPLEEADRSAAVTDYLEMMDTYRSDGKIGGLGLQAVSAYLLFATAANECLADNDNVLERECVLARAREVTDWTGGGMHAPTNPGSNEPPTCTMLLTAQGGEWMRLWPELGGAEDSGNGFACDPDSNVPLTGDYGDATAGVDPSRPS